MRCSEREREELCSVTAQVSGDAALTHCFPPATHARAKGGWGELAVVLTNASTATVSLYAAQLSAAIVLEKEVYVDGGPVGRSVGELPLRVPVWLYNRMRMHNV